MNIKTINGEAHVWSILDNCWVTLEYWNEIGRLLLPTVDDVRRDPGFWISGSGKAIAERTLCPHDYYLTDSCPNC